MELIIHIYTKWSDPQKKDKKNNRKFLIYIHVFLQWWSISLKASNCKFFKVQSSMNISWSIWFYFESKHDIIQRKSKIPWPTFIEIRSPSSINMEVNVLFTVLCYCLQKNVKICSMPILIFIICFRKSFCTENDFWF